MDELIKTCGFESTTEFYKLISSVLINTPERLKKFKDWQMNDGTKTGLLKLERDRGVIMKYGRYYELSPGEISKGISDRVLKQVGHLMITLNNPLITIQQAQVTQLNDKTVVILKNNSNGFVGIGWALRGKKDKYNPEIGLRVALGRAVLHMIETFTDKKKVK